MIKKQVNGRQQEYRSLLTFNFRTSSTKRLPSFFSPLLLLFFVFCFVVDWFVAVDDSACLLSGASSFIIGVQMSVLEQT